MQVKQLLVFLVLWCGHLSTSAQAQATDESFFDARLMLGLSGSGELTTSVQGLGATTEVDPEVSVGAGVSFVHLFHRHFGLGGMLSLHSWQSDAESDVDADRNLLMDLSLLPQGIVTVSSGIDLYVSIPVGLSLDFLNGIEEAQAQVAGVAEASTDVDPALGFHYGALLGVRAALLGQAGLFAELGYVAHSFSHDLTVQGTAAGIDFEGTTELDISFGQFALNLGAFF